MTETSDFHLLHLLVCGAERISASLIRVESEEINPRNEKSKREERRKNSLNNVWVRSNYGRHPLAVSLSLTLSLRAAQKPTLSND